LRAYFNLNIPHRRRQTFCCLQETNPIIISQLFRLKIWPRKARCLSLLQEGALERHLDFEAVHRCGTGLHILAFHHLKSCLSIRWYH
jgi:hypothetical protein